MKALPDVVLLHMSPFRNDSHYMKRQTLHHRRAGLKHESGSSHPITLTTTVLRRDKHKEIINVQNH